MHVSLFARFSLPDDGSLVPQGGETPGEDRAGSSGLAGDTPMEGDHDSSRYAGSAMVRLPWARWQDRGDIVKPLQWETKKSAGHGEGQVEPQARVTENNNSYHCTECSLDFRHRASFHVSTHWPVQQF